MRVQVHAHARLLLALTLSTGVACSSGGGGTTDPTGSFTISVSPGAVSVVQGASGQATVTLTRVDGFAGTVNFTVEGAPTGVSGSVSGGGTGAVSTGTVTIAVGAAVAPGTYNLTLRATANGLPDRTAPFALTVTPSGGFTLSTTLPGLTVVQGGTGSGAIVLARTGSFAGAVALSVTGLPTGVTAVFAPATIAAGSTTADLNFTVGGAVPTGNYPLVITGAATGLPNATVNFTLTVNPAPVQGSFTLSAAPAVLGIAQGSTGQSTITITRAGGFTGAVTLALTGTSTGITASFNPAVVPAGSTTAVMTITVAPPAATPPAAPPMATPLGDYPLVVTGTATGVANATAGLTVSVTPAPGGSFTMAFAPPAATVQAGNNVQSTLTVTRTSPFVGGVSLSISALPAGVQASFAPVAITAGGTTTQLTLTTSQAAAAGTYPLVVTGVGDGVNVPNATANFTLTLTPAPGGGPIGFQFCDPAFAPLWFAFQDQAGIGPWIPVTAGAGTTYSFDITANTGGVAWVEPDGNGGFSTQVIMTSRSALVDLAAANCTRTPASKTVMGSVAGLGVADNALIALGTRSTFANAGNPNFTIQRVPSGNRTLIASRSVFNMGTFSYSADKIVIRRNQNIAPGGTIPVINFGSEGFAPVFQNVTINNLMGWLGAATSQYFTDNGGSAGIMMAGSLGGSSQTFPTVPGAQQVAGDLHYLTVSANPSAMDASQFRSVGRFFFVGAPQTLTLGPAILAPTVSSLAGAGYARLQASGTAQSEYGRLMILSYSQTGRSASLTVTGSPFVVGAPNYLLAFPNFSGLAGWQNSWMPATGVATTWSIFGQGWDQNGILGGIPAEGEVVLGAGRGGQITP